MVSKMVLQRDTQKSFKDLVYYKNAPRNEFLLCKFKHTILHFNSGKQFCNNLRQSSPCFYDIANLCKAAVKGAIAIYELFLLLQLFHSYSAALVQFLGSLYPVTWTTVYFYSLHLRRVNSTLLQYS